MKILFICDEYPPGKNGGIGTTVQNLGRELVKQGHSVYVAGLYAHRYGEKDFEIDNGVKVWRLRYSINLHLSSQNKLYTILERLPDGIKKRLNGKVAFKKFLKFIEELIRSEGIDVIEIADFNGFAMYIGFTINWPAFDVPLVLKSHGSYTYFAKELNENLNADFVENDRLLFARADAISCVSHYTAHVDKNIFSLRSEVKVLYNGIVLPKKTERTVGNKQKVVFTGTLVYKKGIYSLLLAWNKVVAENRDTELFVYGKGNLKKLKKLLNDKSAATVHFMGHVPKAELLKELETAHLAVFPSYSETFGMGVVEAMSVGCPVIYTKRSCGPEIVKENEEGLLVDPDNIEELSEKMLYLLRHPDKAEELAAKALVAVRKKFNIEHSALEHLHFYSEVIAGFKKLKV